MSANTASQSDTSPSGASTRKTALHGDGEHDVLPDDARRAPAETDGLRQLSEVVAHEGDIGCLERGVGACGAHGDAKRGAGQGGSVVDAVADHGDGAVALAAEPTRP